MASKPKGSRSKPLVPRKRGRTPMTPEQAAIVGAKGASRRHASGKPQVARITPQDLFFVEEYLRTGVASQAWATAFPEHAAACQPQTWPSRAARRLANKNIDDILRPIMAEHQAAVRKRAVEAGLSKLTLTEYLLTGFHEAMAERKWGEMRQLGRLLAELGGYIVDRKEVRVVRSLGDLTDEELAAIQHDLEHEATETRH